MERGEREVAVEGGPGSLAPDAPDEEHAQGQREEGQGRGERVPASNPVESQEVGEPEEDRDLGDREAFSAADGEGPFANLGVALDVRRLLMAMRAELSSPTWNPSTRDPGASHSPQATKALPATATRPKKRTTKISPSPR